MFEVKKKGMSFAANAIGGIIIAVAVFIIILVVYGLLNGKLASIGEYISNLFKFGK